MPEAAEADAVKVCSLLGELVVQAEQAEAEKEELVQLEETQLQIQVVVAEAVPMVMQAELVDPV